MMEGDELAAWLRRRAGRLTASRMRDAMDFKKGGAPTEKRSKLMRELLAERLTQDSIRHFTTDAMLWGLEKEAEAKAAYEAHTGVFIDSPMLYDPDGFFDHQRIDALGASPDGFIGRDGLIETKCPTTPTFTDWVLAGVVPDEHKPQMIIQLACTGRKWCEFVAYDPRIRVGSKLFVRRFVPTDDEIKTVEAAAEQFLSELDDLFDAFVTAQAA